MNKNCLICLKPVLAKGYCTIHYQRFRKFGDPLKIILPKERKMPNDFVPWNKGSRDVQKAWNKGLKIQTNTGKTHFKKGMLPWNKKNIALEERFCKCGCANLFICKINSNKKYIPGHNLLSLDSKNKRLKSIQSKRPWNYGLTKEIDNRILQYSIKNKYSHKGQIPWHTGKKWSIEIKNKISQSRLKGLQEGKIKIWNKGLTKKSDKRIQNIAMKLVGKTGFNKGKNKFNDENYKRLSELMKGRIPWNKGLKCPQLARPRYGKDNWMYGLKGELTPGWKGGIGKLPYPYEFNIWLKEKIRERDNYECQLCNIPQKNLLEKLHIHHIDYNKNNLSINNLISLCRKCHCKTNWKRIYWENYFKNKEYSHGF